mgnify:CR=1 FL=1
MISNNLSVICICSVLLTTIVLPYAAGGGGVPVLASEEFLTIESGFILPLDSNSIFMQHQIANNYGKPITVTVSSYQSAAVDLIDSVCDPMTIYPQQVMLIPYQPLNLDDLNRYTMLQASIDFKNPDDNNDEEIIELEGLFRHFYKKDPRASGLNVQRGFKRIRNVRENDLTEWPSSGSTRQRKEKH